MSTLLYTQPGPVPADEAVVRSTVTTVQADAPSSMAPHSPDFNEVATDATTEGGLTSRQLASKVTPGQRFAPAQGNANDDLNAQVNNQISTSGTAAAREKSGRWGHGTLMITEGIEPTILDGHEFGETYFKAPDRSIQGTAGHELSTTDSPDSGTRAAAQATGTTGSRSAVGASMYAAYYDQISGN